VQTAVSGDFDVVRDPTEIAIAPTAFKVRSLLLQ